MKFKKNFKEKRLQIAKEAGREAQRRVREYVSWYGKASCLEGILRLLAIQQLRKKTGHGMTLLPRKLIRK